MAKLVRRSKRTFKSRRAAWMDIEKKTGIRPKTHRLKRSDTKKSFQWEVLGRRKK